MIADMTRIPSTESAEAVGLSMGEWADARLQAAERLYEAGQRYAAARTEAERLLGEARDGLVAECVKATRLGMGCDMVSKCTAERDVLMESGLRTKPDRPKGRPVVTFMTVRRWLEAQESNASSGH